MNRSVSEGAVGVASRSERIGADRNESERIGGRSGARGSELIREESEWIGAIGERSRVWRRRADT